MHKKITSLIAKRNPGQKQFVVICPVVDTSGNAVCLYILIDSDSRTHADVRVALYLARAGFTRLSTPDISEIWPAPARLQ